MLKVMIVDNETVIRKGLAHIIQWESLGCIVTAQAEDGVDALEQISRSQPDIVISDIRMPGMDGLDLAQEIFKHYPWIKVIILTGFPDFEYAKRAISYQVVDFVLKPVSLENLTEAIEKAKKQVLSAATGLQLKKELASKNEQNLELQREMFLRDLLRNSDISHLFLTNRLVSLKLNLTSYYVLRLDVAPLEEGDLSQHYLEQMKRILTDCISDYKIYFIPTDLFVCYGILIAPSAYPVADKCFETFHILSSFPQFLLYIGISLHQNNPLDLEKAAEQANQAVQFAKHSPELPVVCINQVPPVPQTVMETIYHDLKALKTAVDYQNLEKAREILKRLFTGFYENRLPLDTVRSICVYIHQFCIGMVFQSDGETSMEGSHLSALKQLVASNSVASTEETMMVFMEHLLRHAVPSDDAARIIHSVKSHIALHYGDDISLESLASMVHLSPNYLSRLFKKETGENLSIYIQDLRIEEAKTLLCTTSLKTYEVAERVGIPDPVYFSRIFKKKTGEKPKDYRGKT
uniref:response regulator n=1 Tax=Clostridium sp. NkU-1 TaxID=1095009 RepID=UPI0006D02E65